MSKIIVKPNKEKDIINLINLDIDGIIKYIRSL